MGGEGQDGGDGDDEQPQEMGEKVVPEAPAASAEKVAMGVPLMMWMSFFKAIVIVRSLPIRFVANEVIRC